MQSSEDQRLADIHYMVIYYMIYKVVIYFYAY